MLNYRTTANTNSFEKPLTLADIKEAMDKLAAIPKNDKWIVVDPSGNMYQGTAQQSISLILRQHPLVTFPINFPYLHQNN